jgi:carbamoyltransferase
MNILGISGSVGWDGNISMALPNLGEAWVHGSGAALVMDGVLKNALNEERLSRIKYDGQYPKQAIKTILEDNNVTNEEIDVVVHIGNSCRMNLDLKEVGYIREKLEEYFPNCKVEFLSHHMAHTAATYYTSGFESANVLSFDGAGDHVWIGGKEGRFRVPHFIFCRCEGLEITEISAGYTNDPDTFFGALYGYLAAICYKIKTGALEDYRPVNTLQAADREVAAEDEDIIVKLHEQLWASTADRETFPGKIMGLAAFGDHKKIDLPDIFDLDTESSAFPQLHNSPGWNPETVAGPTEEEELILLDPTDLAAWSQYQFEKYLLIFLKSIPIKNDNLCLGGGCALNILANTKIIEEGVYKNVHVNTAPNDDGLCLGAALYMAAKYEKSRPIIPDDIGYLGINYSDEDIENVLLLEYEKFDNFLNLCKRVVEDLLDNKVVAWFQDKSEFGPRALGNRSLLVNPIFDNKDYLNNEVKYREYWRPYAPMVIEEETKEWFTLPVDKSPHMLFNSWVVEDKKERIPSVVHEDGSARVQTVSEINNRKIYMLLQEFFKETGVPVLLNTSFNLGGEPIVESPADAVKTFTNSNIDVLVMQNYYCRKKD